MCHWKTNGYCAKTDGQGEVTLKACARLTQRCEGWASESWSVAKKTKYWVQGSLWDSLCVETSKTWTNITVTACLILHGHRRCTRNFINIFTDSRRDGAYHSRRHESLDDKVIRKRTFWSQASELCCCGLRMRLRIHGTLNWSIHVDAYHATWTPKHSTPCVSLRPLCPKQLAFFSAQMKIQKQWFWSYSVPLKIR